MQEGVAVLVTVSARDVLPGNAYAMPFATLCLACLHMTLHATTMWLAI